MRQMVSVRGPALYVSPGFNVTMGGVEEVEQSSGVMAGAFTNTSSIINPRCSASGNIVTVLCGDVRSGHMEIADNTVLSNVEFVVIANGY
jgi:hypothetical protein